MSKRIIFCSDGTWNDAATNTNVYKIFKAMNFTAEQCPIYDDGVGSDGNPITHFLGGAFGEVSTKKLSRATLASLISTSMATRSFSLASAAAPTRHAAWEE